MAPNLPLHPGATQRIARESHYAQAGTMAHAQDKVEAHVLATRTSSINAAYAWPKTTGHITAAIPGFSPVTRKAKEERTKEAKAKTKEERTKAKAAKHIEKQVAVPTHRPRRLRSLPLL